MKAEGTRMQCPENKFNSEKLTKECSQYRFPTKSLRGAMLTRQGADLVYSVKCNNKWTEMNKNNF